ncbi:MAG: hypothetical protein JJ896_09680 [Rhodothermales bacterium]|nr:hypothetical protein [Rhodothermales bacterium]MBO6779909.1 hypothetical protein [Rhodothermales bacterium]
MAGHSLSETQAAYKSLRDALESEPSDRMKVFLVARFLLDLAPWPEVRGAYAEELLSMLPAELSASELRGADPETLLTVSDVIEAAALGIGRDAIGELRCTRIFRLVEQLSAAASRSDPGRSGYPSVFVPLREPVPTEAPFLDLRVERFELRAMHRSAGMQDDVALLGALLDASAHVVAGVRKPALAARNALQLPGRLRFKGVVATESGTRLEPAELSGLGLGLLVAAGMSRETSGTERLRMRPHVAACGTLEADGTIGALPDDFVSACARAALHAGASVLVVPQVHEELVRQELRLVAPDWPDRSMHVVSAHKLDTVLHDARVFERRKIGMWQRLFAWFGERKRSLAALAVLIVLALFLSWMELGPNPVLRAVAPAAELGAVSGSGETARFVSVVEVFASGDGHGVAGTLDLGRWVGFVDWHGTRLSMPSYRGPGRTLVNAGEQPAIEDVQGTAGSGLLVVGTTSVSGSRRGFWAEVGPNDREVDGRIFAEPGTEFNALCRDGGSVLLVGSVWGDGFPMAAVWSMDEEAGEPVRRSLTGVPAHSSGLVCHADSGELLIGGWRQDGGRRMAYLAKVEGGQAGEIPLSWSALSREQVDALIPLPDGAVAVVGPARWGIDSHLMVQRLTPDRRLDARFGIDGLYSDFIGKATRVAPAAVSLGDGRLALAFSTRDYGNPEEPEPKPHFDGVATILTADGRLEGSTVLGETASFHLSAMTARGDSLILVGIQEDRSRAVLHAVSQAGIRQ